MTTLASGVGRLDDEGRRARADDHAVPTPAIERRGDLRLAASSDGGGAGGEEAGDPTQGMSCIASSRRQRR
jgi:hypothetical protein